MSQTTIDHTPPDADQAEFDADMAYMRGLVERLTETSWTAPAATRVLDQLAEGTTTTPPPPTSPAAPAPSRWLTPRRVAGILAATVVLVGCAIGWAARADAAPGVGCETIRWGFLGSQLRTVCDTPRRPDGSWTRAREVWVPAGWVRGYCSFGYFSSCSQGYYRERGTVAYEEYPVTDGTVLPDEPGWLPTGSVVIR